MEEAILNPVSFLRRGTRIALRFAAAILVLGAGCAPPPVGTAPQIVDARTLQRRVTGSAGHPVLLVFWATWCKPCVEELPTLVALHTDAPRGLRVMAVSLDIFLSGDSTLSVVQSYLATHPAPVEHLIYQGTQDAIFAGFQLPGNIPYAILYDATGQILRRFEGAVDPTAVRSALDAS